jgi:hypothetical protein
MSLGDQVVMRFAIFEILRLRRRAAAGFETYFNLRHDYVASRFKSPPKV